MINELLQARDITLGVLRSVMWLKLCYRCREVEREKLEVSERDRELVSQLEDFEAKLSRWDELFTENIENEIKTTPGANCASSGRSLVWGVKIQSLALAELIFESDYCFADFELSLPQSKIWRVLPDDDEFKRELAGRTCEKLHGVCPDEIALVDFEFNQAIARIRAQNIKFGVQENAKLNVREMDSPRGRKRQETEFKCKQAIEWLKEDPDNRWSEANKKFGVSISTIKKFMTDNEIKIPARKKGRPIKRGTEKSSS